MKYSIAFSMRSGMIVHKNDTLLLEVWKSQRIDLDATLVCRSMR